MSVFDFAGSNNAEDAGGAGAPVVPEAAGIPSVAGGAPAAVEAPPPDPRLAVALAQLQPHPLSGWQLALQKIAPIIGALGAMQSNSGGAFAQAWNQGELHQQQMKDLEAQRSLRLADILHQQQQEQYQAKMAANAQMRIEAAAKKEQAAKNEKLLRDEWTAQSQGGLIDTLNELIDSKGPEAADQYMQSTHIGSLSAAGVPNSVKDLVDRYAVKGPDGHYIGGKTKTPKETKAGTQEDWVSMAEQIEEKKRGRPLTDDERKSVDGAAITEYKKLSKDPDQQEQMSALRNIQVQLAQARIDQLKDQKGDAQEIAAGIIDGTQAPDTSRLYGKSAAVKAELHRQGFDLAKAELDWKSTSRYYNTLNSQQQIRLRQAVSFTKESLGVIEDLSRQWKGGPFPLLNKANLIAASHGAYGPEAASIATRLISQVNDLTSELGTVYKGGYSATDESLKLAAQNLKAEWDEKVLRDNIEQVRKNLTMRENSIKNVGAVSPSESNPYMPGVTPKTQADPLGIR